MNLLIVGAGAVGQVYARHLQKAGHQVSLLVRPKYKVACDRGMVLYELSALSERTPLKLKVHEVLTAWDEVKARRFDQIWITLPTNAITKEWVQELQAAAGDATIVSMTPGMAAQTALRAHVPEEQLVFGMIGIVSFQAPLPGDTLEPGIAYVTSALSPNMFGGTNAARAAQALSAGGCPSGVKKNLDATLALGSALLMPQVLCLEMSGWSLQAHRRKTLKLACRAGHEAQQAVAAQMNLHSGVFSAALVGPFASLVCLFGPLFLPFDLEAYLKFHFSKVREQTVLLLQGYQQTAVKTQTPHPALCELLAYIAEDSSV
jgi:Ketopantoate reductase PanE/ApbA